VKIVSNLLFHIFKLSYILLHCRSLSDSTETSIGYSQEKFDSVTEATATHRNTSDAVPSVNVSKQLSHPIIKSPPIQNRKLQRQHSGGGESDVSMNRSGRIAHCLIYDFEICFYITCFLCLQM